MISDQSYSTVYILS